MATRPAVCLVWLKLWSEQWNNCIYFKIPPHTARFLATKHPFQFSSGGSNYLARHLRGSCLKGNSWGENTDSLAVWLEEITTLGRMKNTNNKVCTEKAFSGGKFIFSCQFRDAPMVQAYSAPAWTPPNTIPLSCICNMSAERTSLDVDSNHSTVSPVTFSLFSVLLKSLTCFALSRWLTYSDLSQH